MSSYPLSRSLTQIDDHYLTMADQTIKEVQTMRQKHFRTRKAFRTILIAAVITALLGITAYAVGSIHAARQNQLRAALQIEENAVSGYTEYTEDASPAPSETSREAAPHIQLISSLQQGDFQAVYFSISPVSEEIVHSFFFDNMVTEFSYIASNREIPEESWYTAGRDEEGIEKITGLFGDSLTVLEDRLDAIRKAASSYKNYGGALEDENNEVKFIFKTDAVSKDEE